ncbi:hypothetical protein NE237_033051 [Protea cynaroides]|uniref:Uncharacterized protein n=1 Tax=Protea cynaroides TaxID=273540 RepID=A0A9Q0R405_9MAGN|nr:hypothetical protein NE237_033051 [Protea cynaroides]
MVVANQLLRSMLSVFIFSLIIALLYAFLWWISTLRRDTRELDTTLQLRAVVHNNGSDTITITTTASASATTARGLPPLIIASLPIFLYRDNQDEHGMRECAICLSNLENEEIGLVILSFLVLSMSLLPIMNNPWWRRSYGGGICGDGAGASASSGSGSSGLFACCLSSSRAWCQVTSIPLLA